MSPYLPATVILAMTTAVGTASAGDLKTFRDWIVGCDDANTCTAIGLPAEDFGIGPYLAVTREAGPDGEPSLIVVSPNDSGVAGSGSIALSFDGDLFVDLVADLTDYAGRASLDPDDVADAIAAIRSAGSATVVLATPAGAVSGTVSLSGSAAAFLYMDDVQGRVGTVTAMARPGDRPAASVPEPPALPVVDIVPIEALSAADGVPEALPRVVPEDCMGPDPYIAFSLGDEAELWGVCTSSGAYNAFYDFHLVRDGEAEPAVFPGQEDGGTMLVNPWVTGDGLLASFAKARGIGDCGVLADYAFDGEGFVAVRRAVMGECRGVDSEDWPVLDRAEAR